jgi:hypothetical protein
VSRAIEIAPDIHCTPFVGDLNLVVEDWEMVGQDFESRRMLVKMLNVQAHLIDRRGWVESGRQTYTF